MELQSSDGMATEEQVRPLVRHQQHPHRPGEGHHPERVRPGAPAALERLDAPWAARGCPAHARHTARALGSDPARHPARPHPKAAGTRHPQRPALEHRHPSSGARCPTYGHTPLIRRCPRPTTPALRKDLVTLSPLGALNDHDVVEVLPRHFLSTLGVLLPLR